MSPSTVGRIVAKAPACNIFPADRPIDLSLTSDIDALDVVVAATDPEGTETVIARVTLNRVSQKVSIDPAVLRPGTNAIAVWARDASADPFLYAARVRSVAVVGGSTLDADGDCFTVELGDCDDGNPAINPDAPEICGDHIDNDCNGAGDVREAICAGECPDADHDGAKAASCGGDDCDDENAARRPGAAEVCNDIDDDCDGAVDETFDLDGDGFTTCASAARMTNGAACPSGLASCADCDDESGSVHPGPHGAVSGTCGNGILDSNEECEDGNALPGDGCDASCIVECPSTGTTYKDPATHVCYVLFAPADPSAENLYFGNAAERCDSLAGGRLATLQTNALLTAVTTQFGAALFANGAFAASYFLWVGGGDFLQEGAWKWNEGTPISGGWKSGEPTNSGSTDDCLTLRKDKQLASEDCVTRSTYGGVLCEVPAARPQCAQ